MMTRFERLTIGLRAGLLVLLALPVTAGLVGVLLPALGYLPALGQSAWSLSAFRALFDYAGVTTMMWLSLSTGLAATCIALCGALALVAVFHQQRWLQQIQRWLSPLLVLPHAAAAIALLFVLSPSGLLARLVYAGESGALPPQWGVPYDAHGISIILALALKELPFLFLMVLSVLSQPQMAARVAGYRKVTQSLGYAPVTGFITIILPILYPHLRLPVLAVLAYATANVEVPLILGPNNPPTLAVAVVHWFNHVDLSLRFQAAAAAIVQVGVTLTAVILWLVAERLIALLWRRRSMQGRRHSGVISITAMAWLTLLSVILAGITMLGSTVSWSLATYWPFPALLPDALTLQHWQTGLPEMAAPLRNTLALGLAVSVTAVSVVLLALEGQQALRWHARHRWLHIDAVILPATLYLPLLVPGVAFLFGLVWFQQVYFADVVWLPVYISHLLYVLPYAYIALAVPYQRFDQRYVQVAYGLGKSPLAVFLHVKLPLLFAPVLVALALGLAISFSQYLPTLLPGGGRLPTVTTEAVAMASGSSRRLSAVYVLVQTALPLLAFVLAWWLPGRIFNPAARHTVKESKL
ncbi:ABC transporter permease [Alteromonas halophila]|uniref:ABC transporter permease n=1 Tax=Alteromonas halophila TaxID=516698 RepID=A0A918JEZ7_9ALTE|nr:ABC transporter permease [Alteromonas halophila]GGW77816.1 ABC transporter permease [Alteromonas halophila]